MSPLVPPSSRPSPVVFGQAGQWAPNVAPFGSMAAVAVVASRTYIIRFAAEDTRDVSSAKFLVTTAAGSNDNCDVAIVNSTCTAILAGSGSTAGKLNAAVAQTVNFAASVQLVQGTIYYAVFAAGPVGTTPASLVMTTIGGASGAVALPGNAVPAIEQSFQNAAFPIAVPIVTGGAITSAPVLFFS